MRKGQFRDSQWSYDRPPAVLEVWLGALFRPSEDKFNDYLIRERQPSAGKAFLWIFIGSLIGTALTFGLGSLFTSSLADLLFNLQSPLLGGSLQLSVVVFFCLTPLSALIGMIAFAVWTGIVHFFARTLGGQGTYGKLAYAMAAYGAPLAILWGLVGAIPYIYCLTIPLGVYGFALNITAVKAVNRLDWARAFLATFGIVIGVLVVLLCSSIVLLALLSQSLDALLSELFGYLGLPLPYP